MKTQEVVWRIKPDKKFPWRERNLVYLVLLSYSLWGRKILWELIPATRPKKPCSNELTLNGGSA